MILEKKKTLSKETEAIRKRIETVFFEEEEKISRYSEDAFKKHMQAQEEKYNQYILSTYYYIVGSA